MEEYGWLIECNTNDGPLWWQGGGAWNKDSSYAIRFARKKDAEAMLDSVSPLCDNNSQPVKLLVTDHVWLNQNETDKKKLKLVVTVQRLDDGKLSVFGNTSVEIEVDGNDPMDRFDAMQKAFGSIIKHETMKYANWFKYTSPVEKDK